MSTVTASILVGSRHRRRGGIQPGWLVLVHEGSGVAVQLVRLNLFDGEITNGLDEQPGIRWVLPRDGDLVGALSLMLQLHVVADPEALQASHGRRWCTQSLVRVSDLSPAEWAVFDEATDRARLLGDARCLSVTALPGSSLDVQDLLTLPRWEIEVSQSVHTRTWNPDHQRPEHGRRLPDLLSDPEIALSRFVTGIVFGGMAGQTVADFLQRAAEQPDPIAADVLGRWVLAGVDAISATGAFSEGEAAGLSEVLEDLAPEQARLLAGFLAPDGTDTVRAASAVEVGGDPVADLHDLLVLACRVAAHAVALTSNTFHLPPWLVLDALDPTTPRGLPDYV